MITMWTWYNTNISMLNLTKKSPKGGNPVSDNKSANHSDLKVLYFWMNSINVVDEYSVNNCIGNLTKLITISERSMVKYSVTYKKLKVNITF